MNFWRNFGSEETIYSPEFLTFVGVDKLVEDLFGPISLKFIALYNF